MTVLEDRIMMAESDNASTLDEMFEKTSAPEGFRVEIVEGDIYMTPQRDTHWAIIRRIVRAMEDKFGMDVNVLSDVRVDFPGDGNGFCPDVVKMRDSAKKTDGRWSHEDVEFVAEVISRGTAANDYGPKLDAYAKAKVPVYLVADPYQGRCNVYTTPANGTYAKMLRVDFGTDVDLTGTVVDLILKTDGFPRD